uniref:Uncharacterized protein n=1 Tax=Anguilla anguilla TaxID=7936 RepID=A0A0E9UKG2_ANGAN
MYQALWNQFYIYKMTVLQKKIKNTAYQKKKNITENFEKRGK